MKLIKDYKSFIIEKYSMAFYSGLDEDKPGNNQVVTFDAQTQYEIEGETHGKLSHAIKHYDEFNPVEMNKILDDAIELIDNSNNKILKHIKTKNILYTEISRKSVINTFDMINDKIIQNKQLNEIEKQIKVLFLDKLENLYDELIEDYLENNKNVDDLSLSEIQKLVDGSHKIKFSANFRGDYRNYILDPKTTGLLSSNNTGIFTLFRIDKSGNDLKKASLYLSKDIEIKNPDLKKFFSNLTST